LAWHRLDPWQESVAGLTRLKAIFVIAPLSNGNIALLLNMAKRAGLPWESSARKSRKPISQRPKPICTPPTF
jgi:hypothetical protein